MNNAQQVEYGKYGNIRNEKYFYMYDIWKGTILFFLYMASIFFNNSFRLLPIKYQLVFDAPNLNQIGGAQDGSVRSDTNIKYEKSFHSQ